MNKVNNINLCKSIGDIEDIKFELPFASGIPAIDKILGGVRMGETTVLSGRSGEGKAVVDTQKVITEEGFKEISKIKVNDFIFGQDGKLTKVLGVFPQGEKKIIEVHFSNGTIVECCKDHLWSFKYMNSNKIITEKTSDIIKKYKIKKEGRGEYLIKVPRVEKIVISEDKKFPVDPYVLGVALGDGCLTTKGKFVISNSEFDILDRVSFKTGLSFKRNKNNFNNYFVGGGDIWRKLESLGVCVKSGNKDIPTEYLFGSNDQRMELLKGLFDTDGCVDKKNRLTYHTTSLKLAKSVVSLCGTLGIEAKISSRDRRENKKTSKSIEYKISISTDEKIFKSIKHQLRYDNDYKKKINHNFVKITKIVETDRFEKMTCIMVDNGNKLFALDNFVSTHNTTLLTQMLISLAGQGINTYMMNGETSNEKTKRNLVYQCCNKEILTFKYHEQFDIHEPIICPKSHSKIKQWLDDKFYIHNNETLFTDDIIEAMRVSIVLNGTKMFVVDNLMITESRKHIHDNNKQQKETMIKLNNFANKYNVHVVLVAHISKDASKAAINQYSTSGSSDITNIAHNIISVERLFSDDDRQSKLFEATGVNYDGLVTCHKNREFGEKKNSFFPVQFDPATRRFYNEEKGMMKDSPIGWEKISDCDIKF